MKKLFALGMGAVSMALLFVVIQIGCSSKSSPVSSNNSGGSAPTNTPANTATLTLTPTVTTTGPTRTPTPTLSPTITITPGTPTATATITATSTPTPFVIYSNGAEIGGEVTNEYNGNNNNSANNPTLAATDTSVGGYNGDTEGYLVTWTASEISGMSGWTVYGPYTGMSLGPTGLANLEAFHTCTFYAMANQSCSVGFNAAEPADNSNLNNDTANVLESVTTSWQKFTLTITDGSRSDGYGGPDTLATINNYFVALITTAPGSTPLNVSFDQVQFQ